LLASAPRLAELLEAAGLRRGARVLRIGRGSSSVEMQLAALLGSHTVQMIATVDDPFNVPLPGAIDLCVVTLSLAQTPDVFEELIYDPLSTIVVQGGFVLVQFCRDATDLTLDRLKIAPQVRAALQGFFRVHFGVEALTDPEPVRARLANDQYFEFLGWAPRAKRAVTDEPIVWLALRRRTVRDGTMRGFARSDRPDRYPLRQLGDFVGALRAAGIALLPVDAFTDRIQARCAATQAAPAGPFGLIKLDLHRQIRRPLEVARLLGEKGVPGLFLMMPRHPFNEAFFDAPETWTILRAIADGGHEIGLHLDVFNLLRTFGNLYEGVAAAVDDFHKRGFAVRAATLHGDTRKHLLERGLVREDFFEEDAARSTWDGKPPVGEEYLTEHVRRYSYRTLAQEFGIVYLAEERFRRDGNLIGEAPLTYASDNSHSLQIRNLARGGLLAAPERFRIPPEFARTAAEALRAQPFLALFHPQWFW